MDRKSFFEPDSSKGTDFRDVTPYNLVGRQFSEEHNTSMFMAREWTQ
jgi:hypothetical protein